MIISRHFSQASLVVFSFQFPARDKLLFHLDINLDCYLTFDCMNVCLQFKSKVLFHSFADIQWEKNVECK